ncbi:hypothetical protein CEUSTIGMA_g10182.t1 [Chlamydomonas eustigma]|uniref:Uncharacterized protein n=1 Tax=Chlamydomonas eustigma TaxID=1157962 RepID=A0A250XIC1_9CHLO|nr:hypothetical protein CEUSTIGMA_g10182.t1 [Chlamydomonas eustigma]|eukprot:GAX82756.1 hypothetical protein CEUSTIGMA_g10182.t1 [Chlamydomonas eustigma]
MVHIPFLNIEVPEVKLALLIPELVINAVRLCTSILDTVMYATHPVCEEDRKEYVELVLTSFPREFKKVFKRGLEGRHKNEDQLSSEMEDAAFDYYRRMIRTAVEGATDEDLEDVTAYNLGLDKPSIQEYVQDLYYDDIYASGNDVPLEAQLYGEDFGGDQDTIVASMEEAAQLQLYHAQKAALEREEQVLLERRRLRTPRKQSLGTAANAGVGLALGMAAVKGARFLFVKILSLRRPKAKKTKKPARATHVKAVAGPTIAHAESGTVKPDTKTVPTRPTTRSEAKSTEKKGKDEEPTQAGTQGKSRVRTATRKR